tara:strand:+ start:9514 stop:10734 length:1221 start_codon:yes stop_codon:yes gene_type:complete
MFPECIECRGTKGMCGVDPCPLLSEVSRRLPAWETSRVLEMSGPSPPSMFIGRYGYPDVRAGLTASLRPDDGESETIGDPAELFGRPLEEVAARHASLITGGRRMDVSSAVSPDLVLEATQLVAMSSSSVDIELDFARPVAVGGNPTFDSMSTPMGPAGEVVRAEVIGNAKVSRKIDSITEEMDVLASDAMGELVDSGTGEAQISRMLSSGLLGRKEGRKLVPTRWGITATDDILGKRIWDKVRLLPSLDKVLVFEAEYLDNRFHIILSPGDWAFQMMEAWGGGSLWSENGSVLGDWEEGRPRTKYASRVTGAYYSARLGVLEYLDSIGRSGACLIWRDIGPGYWAPVGVWLIRETVREALKGDVRKFDSLEGAIGFVANRVSLPNDLRTSWFVNRSVQMRLDAFS